MSDYVPVYSIDLSARELCNSDGLFELIQANSKQNNKHLSVDLSCNNFSEFPKAVCHADLNIYTLSLASQLSRVQFYDDATVGLTEIPHEIGVLRETLQKLDLFNNKISRLPYTFIRLNNLKELDLSKNNLHAFPAELCQLKQLQILRLCGNRITYIPQEIENLQNLVSFYLDHNELTEITRVFCELNVKVLSLRGNKLNKLPHQKFDLQQLDGIQLDSLMPPDETLFTFGSLHELQDLDLSKNSFEDVPACVCELGNLEILNLNENNISKLPRELVKLKNLRILKLDNNKLKGIPLFIGRLKNLRSASFVGNNVTTIPLELNMEAREIDIITESVEKLENASATDSKDKRRELVTDKTRHKDPGYHSGVSICSTTSNDARGLSDRSSMVSLERTSVNSNSMMAIDVSHSSRGCHNTDRPASLESACYIKDPKDKRRELVTDETQHKDPGYHSGVSICSTTCDDARGLSDRSSMVSLERNSVNSDSMMAIDVSHRSRGCHNTDRPASLESACYIKGFEKLTERYLMDIAEHLALRDALKLGIELNISETRVENIEQQYHHDARRVIFKILKTWRDSISVDDEDAAVDKLEGVLCKIGKNCLCGRFKTAVECNKSTEQSVKQTTV